MARRQKKTSRTTVRIIVALSVALVLLSVIAASLVPSGNQVFGGRAPKMALPTLTCVAPNCTPISKSALMPIERI